ncbi:thioredoxin-like protein [Gigaspora rosea]|uniref:Monothiol glutaredoxin-5, mitochondrial n=1 Tax=Gigaspora rosea TaxID=44941 RepID=A0A397UJN0_9GLOM|nr:thioredoxin-like protein [Gigaspora rosea]
MSRNTLCFARPFSQYCLLLTIPFSRGLAFHQRPRLTLGVSSFTRGFVSRRGFTISSGSFVFRRLPKLVSPNNFSRSLSNGLKQTLDEKNDVVLFMKGTPDSPQCGFSRAVVQILNTQGVDFKRIKTFNVLEDQELREGIKEYSKWPTVPQVYIKGEFIGGCDIMLNMHQSGELEDLLVKEGLINIEDPPIDSQEQKQ